MDFQKINLVKFILQTTFWVLFDNLYYHYNANFKFGFKNISVLPILIKFNTGN
jgi:hypothetical protein